MELCKIIIRIWLISTCMNVMHANSHTICNTNTHSPAHTLVWATVSSTSSPPEAPDDQGCRIHKRTCASVRDDCGARVAPCSVLSERACQASGEAGLWRQACRHICLFQGCEQMSDCSPPQWPWLHLFFRPLTSPPRPLTINLQHVPPLRSPELPPYP